MIVTSLFYILLLGYILGKAVEVIVKFIIKDKKAKDWRKEWK